MYTTITRHGPWPILYVLKSSEHSDIHFLSYAEVTKTLIHKKIGLHDKVKFTSIKNDIRVTIFTTPGLLLISELVSSSCNFVMNEMIWN